MRNQPHQMSHRQFTFCVVVNSIMIVAFGVSLATAAGSGSTGLVIALAIGIAAAAFGLVATVMQHSHSPKVG